MVHAITTTGQPFRYISKRLIFLIGLLPGYFCQSERQLVVYFTYQEYTTITNISIAAKTILPLPKPGDRSELEIKLPLGLHIRSEKNNKGLGNIWHRTDHTTGNVTVSLQVKKTVQHFLNYLLKTLIYFCTFLGWYVIIRNKDIVLVWWSISSCFVLGKNLHTRPSSAFHFFQKGKTRIL